ncbi:MAG: hypothetical protein HYZ91_04170 [Candidatus Omnitrophica bacterium]|nr:hypothetical protein [Candidatus Omnitrophota bacterium]
MRRPPRSRSSVRYAFDETNQLVVRERDGRTGRLMSRRVLEGAVTVDRANRLIYHVRTDSGSPDPSVPTTVVLDGTWTLSPDHELALRPHDESRPDQQTLTLRGALVQAQADAAVFALQPREGDGARSVQQLRISGRWAADADNRLSFLVERADGLEDRLTLQSGWEVGPDHALRYRYRRRATTRHLSGEHALTFEGAWDLTDAHRLRYRLSGSRNSSFDFSTSLESPDVLARDGRLVFRVDIGRSGGNRQRRRIVLAGRWTLRRDASVSFEIPYADGRVQAIRFEAVMALSRRDRVSLALHDSRRRPLGLTVTFTHELMPDAKLFLRLRKDADETSALGGIQVRF